MLAPVLFRHACFGQGRRATLLGPQLFAATTRSEVLVRVELPQERGIAWAIDENVR
jgi:hypothetical protein